MLETLEKELPKRTIIYSSKVVSIEESGNFKLVHLANGSVVKTKMVSKWLGLQNPDGGGRSVIRGFVNYPNGHGFEAKFHAYFGRGFRFGFILCDDKTIYCFCTLTPSIFNCNPFDFLLCLIREHLLFV
ncbi:FAD/NAD(P)-binding oxidoreductase family protein [Forsythia ovata]|uniref:FAD/NAD(P)-binding oxidoreductase family protein n=1 Tax=Forsythia ovata TaxID=205694 RepID=A0ABD1T855_9LAMI